MRRPLVSVVAIVLVLGACGGGDDSSAEPTTTRPTSSTTSPLGADCPVSFQVPVRGSFSDECRSTYLHALADQEGATLTEAAETQAKALCREMGTSGVLPAFTNAQLAWEDGSRPRPAEDLSGFVAMATGIYCPDYFDQIKSAN